jgi:hypothetical protein
MVSSIRISGPALKIFRIEILGYTTPNWGVLDAWRWELHAARGIFPQKTCTFLRNRHFYLFWGGFVWGLYGGGLNRKCLSFVRDLSFCPARHTPQQFSRKAQGTDQLLRAFWTAGFTALPPDIGSLWCNLIFQVSYRTIRCILKRSARLYGDCMEPDHKEE